MRTLPLVLALTLLAPVSALAMPEADQAPEAIGPNHAKSEPIPYVIVTTRLLRTEFIPLAREHTHDGLRAGIWTIESIRPAYPSGRDDAERVRMFLQDAYRSRGARWVLIGGDDTQIPMRRATIHPTGVPYQDTILLATDQYYACLKGTWNANGNDQWGEYPADSVDTTPELMIGRAPVASRDEARRFVDRTIRALDSKHREGGTQVLMAANWLHNHVLDFAWMTEQLRPLLEEDPHVEVTRLYENSTRWPGSQAESRTALIAALDRGPELAILFGAGGLIEFTAGNEFDLAQRFTSADAASLENDRKTIYCFLSAYTCAPNPFLSCIGRALMNDPNGGAVAVMGPTDLEFAETGFVYIQMLLDQIYVSGVRTLGEAMFRVAGKAPFGAGRVDLTFQGTMLFGDPALPMSPSARVAPPPTVVMTDRLDGAGGFSTTDLASRVAPRAGRRPVAGSDALAGSMSAPLLSELQRAPVFALEGASPNPAVGGALTVAFSLKGAEPAELELIDVSGRRVATQEVGSLGPGRHVLNLAEGLRIQPGIYIVRLTEAGHSLTQRVAALR